MSRQLHLSEAPKSCGGHDEQGLCATTPLQVLMFEQQGGPTNSPTALQLPILGTLGTERMYLKTVCTNLQYSQPWRILVNVLISVNSPYSCNIASYMI